MTESKNFFRTAFDAIVEARSREAQRQIERYRQMHDFDRKAGDRF
ncbi:MAG TPA: hypothetical protein VIL84_02015 [Devosiaceae bacterium]